MMGYITGPDPANTGAPGEQTCAQAGCHTGAGNPTAGSGIRLDVTTYTPGQKVRLTVTIDGTNPGVTRPIYGFQAVAKLVSNNAQAGTFTPTDATTQVICENNVERTSRPCSVLEYVEHKNPKTTNTFSFDWTPPATSQGNIRIYIAANVANNNGANTGDRVYTNNFTLTPAAGSPPPAIRTDQPVLQSFNDKGVLSSQTWLQIFGSNFTSGITRTWAGSDFNGVKAPISVEGVTVNVNGKPGVISFVSPGQVNVQAPDDEALGPVDVEVINAAGRSKVTLTKTKTSLALLTTPVFNVGGKQYVAALQTDQVTFVGRVGLIAGVAFRPAKPGDTIIIYAVGCGPTNPVQPAGEIVGAIRNLSSTLQVRFGQTVAQAQGFLSPGFVGLCRIDAVVPNVPSGDIDLEATLDGVPTGQNLFTTIQ